MSDVKRYLMQVFNVDRDILSRIREQEMIRNSYLKATVIKHDVVQESKQEQYDERYMKLFEIEDSISKKIDEVCSLRQRISDEIDRIDDVDCRIILRDRYLNAMSWDSIAEACNYSMRSVTRIHGRALQAFYEINKEVVDKFEISKLG